MVNCTHTKSSTKGWRQFALKDIGKTYTGLSGKAADDFGFGKPYISYMDIFNNRVIDFDQFELVQINKNEKQNKVEYGDIFFTTSSETAEEAGMSSVLLRNLSDSYLNSFCFGFRLQNSETLTPEYASFLFRSNSFRKLMPVLAQGSTRYNLSKKSFLAIKLVAPVSILEQSKIVEILSTCDEVIAQTDAKIQKLKKIKQGLMQDLFRYGIDEKGQIRSESTHKFKDSPLGRIPEDWGISDLGGVSLGGAKNGYFKNPKLVGKGHKLINVSELYQTYGIDTTLPEVERVWASESDLKTYGVKVGDLFFTRSSLVLSGIAYCNIIRKIEEPTLFECHVIRVRPNMETMCSEFLAFFCRSKFARKYFMRRAKQVTMATISQADLQSLPVPVPNLDEQQKISNLLFACYDLIERFTKQKNKYISIKSGLMENLLSGKVRVVNFI